MTTKTKSLILTSTMTLHSPDLLYQPYLFLSTAQYHENINQRARGIIIWQHNLKYYRTPNLTVR